MTDAIQIDELEAEIRMLKTKKAPGPDEVTNDMIAHLGSSAKKAILALFDRHRSCAVEKGHNNPSSKERKRQETSQQLKINQHSKLPRKATRTYRQCNTDGLRWS